MREIAETSAPICSWTWRTSRGWSRAACIPARCRTRDFVTTTTHKTLRGPRGGLIMCKEEFAKTIDAQAFPGIQGGPLMHVIAAKAVCFHEALQPAFKDYARQIVNNAKALAARLCDARLPHRVRRHRQSPHAGGSSSARSHRDG